MHSSSPTPAGLETKVQTRKPAAPHFARFLRPRGNLIADATTSLPAGPWCKATEPGMRSPREGAKPHASATGQHDWQQAEQNLCGTAPIGKQCGGKQRADERTSAPCSNCSPEPKSSDLPGI